MPTLAPIPFSRYNYLTKYFPMSIFCHKQLEPPESLGTIFNKQRLTLNFDLKKASTGAHIAEKYLQALETEHYRELPLTKAHRLAYIKEYAEFLNLDPTKCQQQFVKEHGLDDLNTSHPRPNLKILHLNSASVLIKNIGLLVVILVFAGYLIWQVKGVLTPPKLTVFTPMEGSVTNHPTTIVQGVTAKETQLSINGQEIVVDENGKFNTVINLVTGVNTITVAAEKKHGKTTTITRHVVVKDKKVE